MSQCPRWRVEEEGTSKEEDLVPEQKEKEPKIHFMSTSSTPRSVRRRWVRPEDQHIDDSLAETQFTVILPRELDTDNNTARDVIVQRRSSVRKS